MGFSADLSLLVSFSLGILPSATGGFFTGDDSAGFLDVVFEISDDFFSIDLDEDVVAVVGVGRIVCLSLLLVLRDCGLLIGVFEGFFTGTD